jgi:N utilization substance protein A
MFAEKEVVDGIQSPQTEASLEQARSVAPEAVLGDMVMVDSPPEDFGRVAAQTAKQVILQRLREAERDAQYEEFVDREGDMVHGTVHSITPQAVTIGLGRAEAILPRNQQIPGENFRVRDRIRVYVLEVRKSSRGPVIVVTRTHPNMLRRLLEMEVPEINTGLVEIKAIAREAGKRAKVAVAAMREGIDPVGACVGLRGVRIQSIVRDLNDEKIDVIEWNPDSATFILKALSPARVSGVYLDEDPERGRTALVVVPEDQLSLAIGRAGVNARLAARLTGWRIDIKSLVEAASESLNRLRTDPLYTDLIAQFEESLPHIEGILAKKDEGRPVTPEEYSALTSFVERVQREVEARRGARRLAYLEKLAQVRGQIPPKAYDTALDLADLPERVFTSLKEAGLDTCGKVLEQLGMNEDKILKLEGFGPKVVEELRDVLLSHPYPQPEPIPVEEPVPVEPAVVEAAAALEGEVAAPIEVTAELEGAPVQAPEAEAVVEGAPADNLEKAFQAIAQQISAVAAEGALEEEEEPEESAAGKKKKAKKKKGARTVVFDEATGGMVVQKRRKPGRAGGWDEGEL